MPLPFPARRSCGAICSRPSPVVLCPLRLQNSSKCNECWLSISLPIPGKTRRLGSVESLYSVPGISCLALLAPASCSRESPRQAGPTPQGWQHCWDAAVLLCGAQAGGGNRRKPVRGQRKAVRYCFINYSPGNGSFRNGQVGGRDHFRDRGCFWGHWLTLLNFFCPPLSGPISFL